MHGENHERDTECGRTNEPDGEARATIERNKRSNNKEDPLSRETLPLTTLPPRRASCDSVVVDDDNENVANGAGDRGNAGSNIGRT